MTINRFEINSHSLPKTKKTEAPEKKVDPKKQACEFLAKQLEPKLKQLGVQVDYTVLLDILEDNVVKDLDQDGNPDFNLKDLYKVLSKKLPEALYKTIQEKLGPEDIEQKFVEYMTKGFKDITLENSGLKIEEYEDSKIKQLAEFDAKERAFFEKHKITDYEKKILHGLMAGRLYIAITVNNSGLILIMDINESAKSTNRDSRVAFKYKGNIKYSKIIKIINEMNLKVDNGIQVLKQEDLRKYIENDVKGAIDSPIMDKEDKNKYRLADSVINFVPESKKEIVREKFLKLLEGGIVYKRTSDDKVYRYEYSLNPELGVGAYNADYNRKGIDSKFQLEIDEDDIMLFTAIAKQYEESSGGKNKIDMTTALNIVFGAEQTIDAIDGKSVLLNANGVGTKILNNLAEGISKVKGELSSLSKQLDEFQKENIDLFIGVNYEQLLDEIEEIDNRTSIYNSSWLDSKANLKKFLANVLKRYFGENNTFSSEEILHSISMNRDGFISKNDIENLLDNYDRNNRLYGSNVFIEKSIGDDYSNYNDKISAIAEYYCQDPRRAVLGYYSIKLGLNEINKRNSDNKQDETMKLIHALSELKPISSEVDSDYNKGGRSAGVILYQGANYNFDTLVEVVGLIIKDNIAIKYVEVLKLDKLYIKEYGNGDENKAKEAIRAIFEDKGIILYKIDFKNNNYGKSKFGVDYSPSFGYFHRNIYNTIDAEWFNSESTPDKKLSSFNRFFSITNELNVLKQGNTFSIKGLEHPKYNRINKQIWDYIEKNKSKLNMETYSMDSLLTDAYKELQILYKQETDRDIDLSEEQFKTSVNEIQSKKETVDRFLSNPEKLTPDEKVAIIMMASKRAGFIGSHVVRDGQQNVGSMFVPKSQDENVRKLIKYSLENGSIIAFSSNPLKLEGKLTVTDKKKLPAEIANWFNDEKVRKEAANAIDAFAREQGPSSVSIDETVVLKGNRIADMFAGQMALRSVHLTINTYLYADEIEEFAKRTSHGELPTDASINELKLKIMSDKITPDFIAKVTKHFNDAGNEHIVKLLGQYKDIHIRLAQLMKKDIKTEYKDLKKIIALFFKQVSDKNKMTLDYGQYILAYFGEKMFELPVINMKKFSGIKSKDFLSEFVIEARKNNPSLFVSELDEELVKKVLENNAWLTNWLDGNEFNKEFVLELFDELSTDSNYDLITVSVGESWKATIVREIMKTLFATNTYKNEIENTKLSIMFRYRFGISKDRIIKGSDIKNAFETYEAELASEFIKGKKGADEAWYAFEQVFNNYQGVINGIDDDYKFYNTLENPSKDNESQEIASLLRALMLLIKDREIRGFHSMGGFDINDKLDKLADVVSSLDSLTKSEYKNVHPEDKDRIAFITEKYAKAQEDKQDGINLASDFIELKNIKVNDLFESPDGDIQLKYDAEWSTQLYQIFTPGEMFVAEDKMNKSASNGLLFGPFTHFYKGLADSAVQLSNAMVKQVKKVRQNNLVTEAEKLAEEYVAESLIDSLKQLFLSGFIRMAIGEKIEKIRNGDPNWVALLFETVSTLVALGMLAKIAQWTGHKIIYAGLEISWQKGGAWSIKKLTGNDLSKKMDEWGTGYIYLPSGETQTHTRPFLFLHAAKQMKKMQVEYGERVLLAEHPELKKMRDNPKTHAEFNKRALQVGKTLLHKKGYKQHGFRWLGGVFNVFQSGTKDLLHSKPMSAAGRKISNIPHIGKGIETAYRYLSEGMENMTQEEISRRNYSSEANLEKLVELYTKDMLLQQQMDVLKLDKEKRLEHFGEWVSKKHPWYFNFALLQFEIVKRLPNWLRANLQDSEKLIKPPSDRMDVLKGTAALADRIDKKIDGMASSNIMPLQRLKTVAKIWKGPMFLNLLCGVAGITSSELHAVMIKYTNKLDYKMEGSPYPVFTVGNKSKQVAGPKMMVDKNGMGYREKKLDEKSIYISQDGENVKNEVDLKNGGQELSKYINKHLFAVAKNSASHLKIKMHNGILGKQAKSIYIEVEGIEYQIENIIIDGNQKERVKIIPIGSSSSRVKFAIKVNGNIDPEFFSEELKEALKSENFKKHIKERNPKTAVSEKDIDGAMKSIKSAKQEKVDRNIDKKTEVKDTNPPLSEKEAKGEIEAPKAKEPDAEVKSTEQLKSPPELSATHNTKLTKIDTLIVTILEKLKTEDGNTKIDQKQLDYLVNNLKEQREILLKDETKYDKVRLNVLDIFLRSILTSHAGQTQMMTADQLALHRLMALADANKVIVKNKKIYIVTSDSVLEQKIMLEKMGMNDVMKAMEKSADSKSVIIEITPDSKRGVKTVSVKYCESVADFDKAKKVGNIDPQEIHGLVNSYLSNSQWLTLADVSDKEITIGADTVDILEDREKVKDYLLENINETLLKDIEKYSLDVDKREYAMVRMTHKELQEKHEVLEKALTNLFEQLLDTTDKNKKKEIQSEIDKLQKEALALIRESIRRKTSGISQPGLEYLFSQSAIKKLNAGIEVKGKKYNNFNKIEEGLKAGKITIQNVSETLEKNDMKLFDIFQGKRMYAAQVQSTVALTKNLIAQLPCGAGKTIVGGATSYVLSLFGKGVHLSSATVDLTLKDFNEINAYLFFLTGRTDYVGSVSANPHSSGSKEWMDFARKAYNRPITYGVMSDFVFDMLRDSTEGMGLQGKGLWFHIADEIDAALIQNALNDMLLSTESKKQKYSEKAYLGAFLFTKKMKKSLYRKIDGEKTKFEIIKSEFEIESELNRMITESTNSEEKAMLKEFRDKMLKVNSGFAFHQLENCANVILNYAENQVKWKMEGNNLEILDKASGASKSGSKWNKGMQQAVEALAYFLGHKNIIITKESETSGRIRPSVFARLYYSFVGMSGTALNTSGEMSQIARTIAFSGGQADRKSEKQMPIYKNREQLEKALLKYISNKQKINRNTPSIIAENDFDKQNSLGKKLWLQEYKRFATGDTKDIEKKVQELIKDKKCDYDLFQRKMWLHIFPANLDGEILDKLLDQSEIKDFNEFQKKYYYVGIKRNLNKEEKKKIEKLTLNRTLSFLNFMQNLDSENNNDIKKLNQKFRKIPVMNIRVNVLNHNTTNEEIERLRIEGGFHNSIIITNNRGARGVDWLLTEIRMHNGLFKKIANLSTLDKKGFENIIEDYKKELVTKLIAKRRLELLADISAVAQEMVEIKEDFSNLEKLEKISDKDAQKIINELKSLKEKYEKLNEEGTDFKRLAQDVLQQKRTSVLKEILTLSGILYMPENSTGEELREKIKQSKILTPETSIKVGELIAVYEEHQLDAWGVKNIFQAVTEFKADIEHEAQKVDRNNYIDLLRKNIKGLDPSTDYTRVRLAFIFSIKAEIHYGNEKYTINDIEKLIKLSHEFPDVFDDISKITKKDFENLKADEIKEKFEQNVKTIKKTRPETKTDARNYFDSILSEKTLNEGKCLIAATEPMNGFTLYTLDLSEISRDVYNQLVGRAGRSGERAEIVKFLSLDAKVADVLGKVYGKNVTVGDVLRDIVEAYYPDGFPKEGIDPNSKEGKLILKRYDDLVIYAENVSLAQRATNKELSEILKEYYSWNIDVSKLLTKVSADMKSGRGTSENKIEYSKQLTNILMKFNRLNINRALNLFDGMSAEKLTSICAQIASMYKVPATSIEQVFKKVIGPDVFNNNVSLEGKDVEDVKEVLFKKIIDELKKTTDLVFEIDPHKYKINDIHNVLLRINAGGETMVFNTKIQDKMSDLELEYGKNAREAVGLLLGAELNHLFMSIQQSIVTTTPIFKEKDLASISKVYLSAEKMDGAYIKKGRDGKFILVLDPLKYSSAEKMTALREVINTPTAAKHFLTVDSNIDLKSIDFVFSQNTSINVTEKNLQEYKKLSKTILNLFTGYPYELMLIAAEYSEQALNLPDGSSIKKSGAQYLIKIAENDYEISAEDFKKMQAASKQLMQVLNAVCEENKLDAKNLNNVSIVLKTIDMAAENEVDIAKEYSVLITTRGMNPQNFSKFVEKTGKVELSLDNGETVLVDTKLALELVQEIANKTKYDNLPDALLEKLKYIKDAPQIYNAIKLSMKREEQLKAEDVKLLENSTKRMENMVKSSLLDISTTKRIALATMLPSSKGINLSLEEKSSLEGLANNIIKDIETLKAKNNQELNPKLEMLIKLLKQFQKSIKTGVPEADIKAINKLINEIHKEYKTTDLEIDCIRSTTVKDAAKRADSLIKDIEILRKITDGNRAEQIEKLSPETKSKFTKIKQGEEKDFIKELEKELNENLLILKKSNEYNAALSLMKRRKAFLWQKYQQELAADPRLSREQRETALIKGKASDMTIIEADNWKKANSVKNKWEYLMLDSHNGSKSSMAMGLGGHILKGGVMGAAAEFILQSARLAGSEDYSREQYFRDAANGGMHWMIFESKMYGLKSMGMTQGASSMRAPGFFGSIGQSWKGMVNGPMSVVFGAELMLSMKRQKRDGQGGLNPSATITTGINLAAFGGGTAIIDRSINSLANSSRSGLQTIGKGFKRLHMCGLLGGILFSGFVTRKLSEFNQMRALGIVSSSLYDSNSLYKSGIDGMSDSFTVLLAKRSLSNLELSASIGNSVYAQKVHDFILSKTPSTLWSKAGIKSPAFIKNIGTKYPRLVSKMGAGVKALPVFLVVDGTVSLVSNWEDYKSDNAAISQHAINDTLSDMLIMGAAAGTYILIGGGSTGMLHAVVVGGAVILVSATAEGIRELVVNDNKRSAEIIQDVFSRASNTAIIAEDDEEHSGSKPFGSIENGFRAGLFEVLMSDDFTMDKFVELPKYKYLNKYIKAKYSDISKVSLRSVFQSLNISSIDIKKIYMLTTDMFLSILDLASKARLKAYQGNIDISVSSIKEDELSYGKLGLEGNFEISLKNNNFSEEYNVVVSEYTSENIMHVSPNSTFVLKKADGSIEEKAILSNEEFKDALFDSTTKLPRPIFYTLIQALNDFGVLESLYKAKNINISTDEQKILAELLDVLKDGVNTTAMQSMVTSYFSQEERLMKISHILATCIGTEMKKMLKELLKQQNTKKTEASTKILDEIATPHTDILASDIKLTLNLHSEMKKEKNPELLAAVNLLKDNTILESMKMQLSHNLEEIIKTDPKDRNLIFWSNDKETSSILKGIDISLLSGENKNELISFIINEVVPTLIHAVKDDNSLFNVIGLFRQIASIPMFNDKILSSPMYYQIFDQLQKRTDKDHNIYVILNYLMTQNHSEEDVRSLIKNIDVENLSELKASKGKSIITVDEFSTSISKDIKSLHTDNILKSVLMEVYRNYKSKLAWDEYVELKGAIKQKRTNTQYDPFLIKDGNKEILSIQTIEQTRVFRFNYLLTLYSQGLLTEDDLNNTSFGINIIAGDYNAFKAFELELINDKYTVGDLNANNELYMSLKTQRDLIVNKTKEQVGNTEFFINGEFFIRGADVYTNQDMFALYMIETMPKLKGHFEEFMLPSIQVISGDIWQNPELYIQGNGHFQSIFIKYCKNNNLSIKEFKAAVLTQKDFYYNFMTYLATTEDKGLSDMLLASTFRTYLPVFINEIVVELSESSESYLQGNGRYQNLFNKFVSESKIDIKAVTAKDLQELFKQYLIKNRYNKEVIKDVFQIKVKESISFKEWVQVERKNTDKKIVDIKTGMLGLQKYLKTVDSLTDMTVKDNLTKFLALIKELERKDILTKEELTILEKANNLLLKYIKLPNWASLKMSNAVYKKYVINISLALRIARLLPDEKKKEAIELFNDVVLGSSFLEVSKDVKIRRTMLKSAIKTIQSIKDPVLMTNIIQKYLLNISGGTAATDWLSSVVEGLSRKDDDQELRNYFHSEMLGNRKKQGLSTRMLNKYKHAITLLDKDRSEYKKYIDGLFLAIKHFNADTAQKSLRILTSILNIAKEKNIQMSDYIFDMLQRNVFGEKLIIDNYIQEPKVISVAIGLMNNLYPIVSEDNRTQIQNLLVDQICGVSGFLAKAAKVSALLSSGGPSVAYAYSYKTEDAANRNRRPTERHSSDIVRLKSLQMIYSLIDKDEGFKNKLIENNVFLNKLMKEFNNKHTTHKERELIENICIKIFEARVGNLNKDQVLKLMMDNGKPSIYSFFLLKVFRKFKYLRAFSNKYEFMDNMMNALKTNSYEDFLETFDPVRPWLERKYLEQFKELISKVFPEKSILTDIFAKAQKYNELKIADEEIESKTEPEKKLLFVKKVSDLGVITYSFEFKNPVKTMIMLLKGNGVNKEITNVDGFTIEESKEFIKILKEIEEASDAGEVQWDKLGDAKQEELINSIIENDKLMAFVYALAENNMHVYSSQKEPVAEATPSSANKQLKRESRKKQPTQNIRKEPLAPSSMQISPGISLF